MHHNGHSHVIYAHPNLRHTLFLSCRLYCTEIMKIISYFLCHFLCKITLHGKHEKNNSVPISINNIKKRNINWNENTLRETD